MFQNVNYFSHLRTILRLSCHLICCDKRLWDWQHLPPPWKKIKSINHIKCSMNHVTWLEFNACLSNCLTKLDAAFMFVCAKKCQIPHNSTQFQLKSSVCNFCLLFFVLFVCSACILFICDKKGWMRICMTLFIYFYTFFACQKFTCTYIISTCCF